MSCSGGSLQSKVRLPENSRGSSGSGCARSGVGWETCSLSWRSWKETRACHLSWQSSGSAYPDPIATGHLIVAYFPDNPVNLLRNLPLRSGPRLFRASDFFRFKIADRLERRTCPGAKRPTPPPSPGRLSRPSLGLQPFRIRRRGPPYGRNPPPRRRGCGWHRYPARLRCSRRSASACRPRWRCHRSPIFQR